jgi:hypothetical protein
MNKQAYQIISSNIVRQVTRCVLAVVLSAGTYAARAEAGGTVEIKLGETIARTLEDAKQGGCTYAPKQDFDPSAKETHVWLPYGTKGIYFEADAVKFTDPTPAHPATALNGRDGFSCVQWGYKLHFDKPISGFRFYACGGELGLKNAVAGAEYSVDGQKWVTLKETDKSGHVSKFLDPASEKATGLKTQDLFVRFYTRSKTDATAKQAENAWIKLWTCGDPSWGDAATTFFKWQPQVWVTPAE